MLMNRHVHGFAVIKLLEAIGISQHVQKHVANFALLDVLESDGIGVAGFNQINNFHLNSNPNTKERHKARVRESLGGNTV